MRGVYISKVERKERGREMNECRRSLGLRDRRGGMHQNTIDCPLFKCIYTHLQMAISTYKGKKKGKRKGSFLLSPEHLLLPSLSVSFSGLINFVIFVSFFI